MRINRISETFRNVNIDGRNRSIDRSALRKQMHVYPLYKKKHSWSRFAACVDEKNEKNVIILSVNYISIRSAFHVFHRIHTFFITLSFTLFSPYIQFLSHTLLHCVNNIDYVIYFHCIF